MDIDLAQEFLAALGCKSFSIGDSWVRTGCPLAFWNHASGTDNHPSFGVRVGEGKTFCHCFACGYKGSPLDLVFELKHRTQLTGVPVGMDLGKALQLADQESAVGFIPAGEWSWKSKRTFPVPWPEGWWTSFFSVNLFPTAMTYLESRGVTKLQAMHFGLRYDTKRNSILFPLRTKSGVLIGVRGRMLSGDLKYFDYKFKDVSNAKFALYNLERTLPDQPLVLVEGTFDALSVAAVWPNVVASLGVSLTREKLSLLKNFLEIWVFFDNDKAGAEGGYKVKKSLKNTLVRMVPYTVDRKDPGSMSTEEIHQSLSLMETHK